ncbi:MAG: phosphate transport system permease protein PstA [Acidimicrobiia bacterium]
MSAQSRLAGDRLLQSASILVLLLSLTALGALLFDILSDGLGRIDWRFLTSAPSRRASSAGIYPAILGSLWIMVVTAALALPLGVGAAVYLEEYAPQGRFARIIEINIANLAGVPSIIYGLLGLGLFVRAFHFGTTILAGGATLALMALPVVILSTREALRTVPRSLREGSYALGATRWQTIWHQVLPSALPSILTGLILAMSRAIGETAPLITVGALAYIDFAPTGVLSPYTVLPIQIFNWVSQPQAAFGENAAAGIIVLLALLLSMNAVAVVLRDRYQKARI